MTRRPRLSLSSDNNVDKKQPPGFEVAIKLETPKTTPNPARTPSATEPSTEDIGAQDPMIEATNTTPRTTTHPAGRQLVKVIVVVIVAALTLYLLKRRLL